MSKLDNWRPTTETGWKALYEFELLKVKQQVEREKQKKEKPDGLPK